MAKTTDCEHGTDLFEGRCGECDDQEINALEEEVDRQAGVIKHLENRLKLYKNIKIKGNPKA